MSDKLEAYKVHKAECRACSAIDNRVSYFTRCAQGRDLVCAAETERITTEKRKDTLANKIDELATYIALPVHRDQERIADLLWAIYHEASDNAVRRIFDRELDDLL